LEIFTYNAKIPTSHTYLVSTPVVFNVGEDFATYMILGAISVSRGRFIQVKTY